MEIEVLSPAIGAIVHGVDLREPLGAARDEVHDALMRHLVLFFRDQPLTQEQHLAFGRAFGELVPGHPTLLPAFPDHPEILLLDNQAGGAGGGNKTGGPMIESRWHTDVTFMPQPPMASILRGLVVPPYGGDTQWTNLVTAYEELSPQVTEGGVPTYRGRRVAPIRYSSTARAHCRPSRIAQTTSDWPRRMSPHEKMFGTEVR